MQLDLEVQVHRDPTVLAMTWKENLHRYLSSSWREFELTQVSCCEFGTSSRGNFECC